ncbi:hypothetical protein [Endozoicomonas numazuensis]|uniref:Uncharacterized protein n=1 Tax=Endozoicomonas numazuensis TaxID=1137799 RepID=A0A081NGM2_9GAMM|nr:hypothetical protein [Endozoicomonas numazuensis]KEQ17595.1 hypothetical protein GZ78_17860 [Endozoicomonas numazuensis]
MDGLLSQDTVGCPYGCGGACNHFLPAPRNRRFYPVGESPADGYILPDKDACKSYKCCNPSKVGLDAMDQLFSGEAELFGYVSLVNQRALDKVMHCLNRAVEWCQQVEPRPSFDTNQVIEIQGGYQVLDQFVASAISIQAHTADLAVMINWIFNPFSHQYLSMPYWYRVRSLNYYGDSIMTILQNWSADYRYRLNTYGYSEFELTEALPQLQTNRWLISNHDGSFVMAVVNVGESLFAIMVHCVLCTR